ncbi:MULTISPECIES: Dabb family protein [Clostridium]|jgi:Stress responsive A/B Barrel Domain.|uniref:Dabb family protein n=4 Tax=Clostridium TaxID=1485 RepID=A0A1S8QZ09_CLOBE|nr:MULTISPECIES: Dabb family protein [Clostridium]ABR36960.1 Stress responsive alpha-beta barrel domain protein [Clostridium beijerinckii NCIMB 8052]AIU03884.1 stress responsive alpha-beta barrel domain-containing protein [Clostridium beijerinckii ATCC 35702]ALB44014.1 Dabb family protein [Clostridium beijerinckii NRRL B-598]AVK48775.1 stress responsive protein [Clostridium sp. MF28]MBC2457553.1 Dabb family protein [Clostridium beijerinckii]
MFTHIVLFKLKEPTTENLKFVEKTLLSMNGMIKELKQLEVGVDVIKSDRSYDVGIITRFDNKEDYLSYDVNEFHVEKVKKVIGPYMEGSKTLDF